MFSLLQRRITVSIGKLLITDINVDLFSEEDGHKPRKQFTENLRTSGYQYVIEASSAPSNTHKVITDTALPVRTIRIYDIETDEHELLSTKWLETFGANYVLIKADWTIPSSHLEDGILKLHLHGYIPVLAKAERYECLQDNYRNIARLLNRGCLFEADIISLTGYHGHASKRLANKLFKEGHISFVGSGASNPGEQRLINNLMKSRKLAKRLENRPIRNKELWQKPLKTVVKSEMEVIY